MLQSRPTDIQAAFSVSPAVLGLSTGGPADPILIRYDGERRADEPVIFGVIALGDVSKMHEDASQSIIDAVASEAGKTDSRAFVTNDGHRSFVYLDSDLFEDVFVEIFDDGFSGGHPVETAVGDLLLLSNASGDFTLGGKSALSTVMAIVPDQSGMAALHAARLSGMKVKLEALTGDLDPEIDDDDSVPQF